MKTDQIVFKIELLKIHWLESLSDEEEIDLCAHGQVLVQIGSETILDDVSKDDQDWTVSAAAIHLMRTVFRDHNEIGRVGEYLVPCCGHHIDYLDDEGEVHIQGCFTGINFWVNHLEGSYIELSTEKGTKVIIDKCDYILQIKQFANRVEEFYKRSKPKKLPDDEYDRKNYLRLWEEWEVKSESIDNLLKSNCD